VSFFLPLLEKIRARAVGNISLKYEILKYEVGFNKRFQKKYEAISNA